MEAQKKKVGNYLLLNKIGQGQFGTVYKGVLIENQNKLYAIKCIQKNKLEGNSILSRLFQTEMHVMSKLNHPNIMHLYEFMETAHNYYLVIQYCNSGDMETYLKKMSKLNEEEAVYFLMQIMNAFQVLHKNKIMHRDVKLANIFLHDDRIVIGDFGFAKQGVDVTRTKLGTPITMAPELLIGNGACYNSKADLWSIGVCFYQMLFGRTPFEAKTYDELKEKVKSDSGSKLRFPKDVSVSEECKRLLIHLLQSDPIQRIEWRDFFNHQLFELHSRSHQTRGFNNINNSLLDRQNEKVVKTEFDANKKTAVNIEQNLLNPDQIKIEAITRRATEEVSIKNDEKLNEIVNKDAMEEAHAKIKARYCHEKKKIIFIMYAVRKLRNLAKLRNRKVFDVMMCDRLMLTTCLLLRKGLLMNENVLNSLSRGSNIFDMEQFETFLKTEENVKILKNFEEDAKIYIAFSNQMNAKFSEEVETPEIKTEMSNYKNITYSDINKIDAVNLIFCRFFKDNIHLCQGFSRSDSNSSYKSQNTNNKSQNSPEIDYCCAVLHFYYSIFSETIFSFTKNGKIFEWKKFDNKNIPENSKSILKSLNF